MTQTVLRYPVREPAGQCVVATVPFSARVLKVERRPADGEISAWAMVYADSGDMTKRVCVAGTGCTLPAGEWGHIDTFFVDAFVFHAFVELT